MSVKSMGGAVNVSVRPAVLGDHGGIAAVRLSNGPAHDDSGVNTSYCRHLSDHEHLWVAVDEGGSVVGYAGAVDIGLSRLLSDMFVHADAHGRGVGSALLAAVLDGATERYTFATTDPAALPLYMRAGMRTRWTLLEMRGPGAALVVDRHPPLDVERVSAVRGAVAESELTGIDLSAAHSYWASRPGASAVVVSESGRTIGVAAVVAEVGDTVLRIDHLAADPKDAPSVVAAVVGNVALGSVHAYVPGSSELASWLLGHRFVVSGISLYMATAGAAVHPRVAIVHPGLG